METNVAPPHKGDEILHEELPLAAVDIRQHVVKIPPREGRKLGTNDAPVDLPLLKEALEVQSREDRLREDKVEAAMFAVVPARQHRVDSLRARRSFGRRALFWATPKLRQGDTRTCNFIRKMIP